MKRRPPIVLILLLLVAGAIVNVVVAWGCGARFNSYAQETAQAALESRLPERTSVYCSVAAIDKGFGMARLWVTGANVRLAAGTSPTMGQLPQWAPTDVRAKWGTSEWRAEFDGKIRVFWAQGWPAFALTRETPKDSMTLGSWVVAYQPIWPGFAINTVFYAVVLWLLFAAPFALRRRRRIKRGLCPKCAYDLRGRAPDSKSCPECGSCALPQPVADARVEGPKSG